MTKVTPVRCPSDVTIVACPAKLPVNDIGHLEIITADTHIEPKFSMTHLAAETDAMKPVGKYYWPHAFLFCPSIENHISILCSSRRRCSNQCQKQQESN